MNNIFFCSDHHLNHKNILKFDTPHNSRKQFKDIEEMHEVIIENHNKVVSKQDQVYFLGDICWNVHALPLINRMNGNKTLIMGNHESQNIKAYLPYFKDCKAVMSFGKRDVNFILTHVPVHPSQLEYRYKHNIHGHLHEYNVLLPDGNLDQRYLNVSMEQFSYYPVELDEIKVILGIS